MRRKTTEEARGYEGGPMPPEQAGEQPGAAAGGEPAEDRAGETAAPEEETGQDSPADGGEPAPAARIAELERELLDARCRLAAFAAGVAPELVGDAVTLAVQAAGAEGEVTEESVAEAMEQVLQRHPGWKADRRRSGGFRLGADAEERPRGNAPAQDSPKRWNRFR